MLYTKRRVNSKWAMQSGELMEALGLKAGGHLPDQGMPPVQIEGVTVYVLPKSASTGGRKSSKHRVMAVCPVCNRHMSAGRLASQHYRKMHKGE